MRSAVSNPTAELSHTKLATAARLHANWLQRRDCTQTGYIGAIAHKLATAAKWHTNWLQLGSCLNLGTGQKPVPLSYTFDGRHIFPVLQLADGSSRTRFLVAKQLYEALMSVCVHFLKNASFALDNRVH